MTKLSGWNAVGVIVLVLAASAIVAQGQIFTSLHSFDGGDGGGPYQESLVQGEDGNFYGTTFGGGTNNGGTIFRITAQGSLTTLYSFCALPNCIDGEYPNAGLVLATDGDFYGTTAIGGANGGGVVFELTPDGTVNTLYSFCAQLSCTDGSNPGAALVQATDGNLYGTAEGGGFGGKGTVFKITTAGELSTVHSFCLKNQQCPDGYSPRGSLIEATDGNLYGTTSSGGNREAGGTAFRIGKNGSFAFLGLKDNGGGGGPMAGLLQASDGNFYGTTYEGGSKGGGTVFKVTATGSQKTLYQFQNCVNGDCSEGSLPTAGLIQATDGNLYGTTSGGGDINCAAPVTGCGTFFQMSTQGFSEIHTFEGSDGSEPSGGFFQATSGMLYGTTSAGGISDLGTVFSLDMGLGPFVAFVQSAAAVGQTAGILGQGFTGTTNVSFNGTSSNFVIVSDTYLTATVPPGTTTGYVTVTTPTGVLTSNVPFHVIQVVGLFEFWCPCTWPAIIPDSE
jgi:uncharacterized repeat protein (TIGR03803 family)